MMTLAFVPVASFAIDEGTDAEEATVVTEQKVETTVDVAEPEPTELTDPVDPTEPTDQTEPTDTTAPDTSKASTNTAAPDKKVKSKSGKNNGIRTAAVATVDAVSDAAPDYELTVVGTQEVPLSGNVLDSHCCVLHLLIILIAGLMLVWYTRDMKKRQARIFELEKELEGYFDD